MQFAGVFFLFFLFYWPSNWKTSSKFFFTFWTTVAPQSLSSDMITIGISFNWTPSFIGIIRIYWATVVSFSIPFEWKYTRLIRAWSTYCFACTWFFTTIHALKFQNIIFCHYFASQLTCSHICHLQIKDFWHCIVMSRKMLLLVLMVMLLLEDGDAAAGGRSHQPPDCCQQLLPSCPPAAAAAAMLLKNGAVSTSIWATNSYLQECWSPNKLENYLL